MTNEEMTNEEAIKIIIDMANALRIIQNTPQGKAIKMAVKVLNQEPCEDAISRKEVLDLCDSDDPEYKICHLKEDVECLPSVQPKQKMGYWIPVDDSFKCSECGELSCCKGKYCNECGAKMKSNDKIKIGCKVRTIKDKDPNGAPVFPKGTIGVIEEICEDSKCPYTVRSGADWWYYSEDMFVVVETVDKIEAKDEVKSCDNCLYDTGTEAFSEHCIGCHNESKWKSKQIERNCGTCGHVIDNKGTCEICKSGGKCYGDHSAWIPKQSNNGIKVGDEIIFLGESKGVVTQIIDNYLHIMCSDGGWGVRSMESCKKTGRHFDQIEELLELMRRE